MNFCHITPTKYLDIFASGRPAHLVLAHLVEEDEKYRDYALFLYNDFSNTFQSEEDVQLKNILNSNYKKFLIYYYNSQRR